MWQENHAKQTASDRLNVYAKQFPNASEIMTMRERIRVGSSYWVIVEQFKDPETTYLLTEGENFRLFGLSNEQHSFRIKRISPMSVDIEITGPYRVLVDEEKCIGDGQPNMEISLKVGESRKVATPTIDAGIVWNIGLEEIV